MRIIFRRKISTPNPYPAGTNTLIFIGAMDYWANIDAVEWFSRSIFSAIRAQLPEVEFYIVGARPTAAVMALSALPGVTVTGSVPDITALPGSRIPGGGTATYRPRNTE